MQLLQYLDTNAFESCVDIMEKVYPGYKALLSNLIDRHQISIVKKVFAFINENGGTQKLADYYNNADETLSHFFYLTHQKSVPIHKNWVHFWVHPAQIVDYKGFLRRERDYPKRFR